MSSFEEEKKEQHASDSQREDKSADASIAAEWSGADSGDGDVLSVTAGVRCSERLRTRGVLIRSLAMLTWETMQCARQLVLAQWS